MQNDPAAVERMIEALEASRPGTNDRSAQILRWNAMLASDAKLRDLYERLQQADARLRAAIGEVPVPAGLHERILARLDANRQERGRRRTHRRLWVASMGVAALAASILVALWIGSVGPRPSDEAGVLAAVCHQFVQESDSDPAEGLLVSETSPPAHLPMSRAVARVPELRWRMVRGVLGRQAVAYDFPGTKGRLATVYVLPAEPSDITRTRPPTSPMQSTGGLSAGIWIEGDRVYVLVVRGDARAYRRLIYAPTGPLT